MTARFCAECGAPLGGDETFCGSCGARVLDPEAAADAGGGAPPGGPPPYVPPPAPTRSSVPVPLVIAVVGALLAGGAIFWASRGGDDDGGGEAAAGGPGEVFLEPAAEPGPDPFTASVAAPVAAPRPLDVAAELLAASGPPATTDATGTTDTAVDGTAPGGTGGTGGAAPPAATTVGSLSAVRPGLYGGTRDLGSCDVEGMIAFLQSEPDKAAAWAAVPGIPVADLPAYLRSLTPVVLRADTRVTNHGYRDGRATPRQAVLQAGTAVLVDELGIPRAKCACGNPLLPPVPTPVTPTYVGPPWPGFDPATVVVVVNVEQTVVTELIVADLDGDGYFPVSDGVAGPEILVDEACDLYPELCLEAPPGDALPPATAPPDTTPATPPPTEPELRTGAIQVTLRWSSSADLDLSVTDPNGDTVDFGNRVVASGGTLDVDANSACTSVDAPVENVVWPDGSGVPGEYTVTVSMWSSCDAGDPQPYELSILVGGDSVPLEGGGSGTVGESSPVTYTFGFG